MKPFHYTFIALLILTLALSACGGAPTPLPNTPTPPVLPTEEAAAPEVEASSAVPPEDDFSPYIPYYNNQADFSFALPSDWVASDPTDDSLGKKVVLGPDPTVDTGNAIIIADAGKVTKEQAINALCGKCTTRSEPKETTINGASATTIDLGSEDLPPVSWYLLQKDDKLIIFSLHDPDTMQTLHAVIGSYMPGKQAYKDPKYSQGAWAAQETFAADLGVSPYEITVQSIQALEWPDSCLGAPDEGEQCEQTVTPGYLGTLQFGDVTSEFHANTSGSQVRLIPGAAIALQKAVADQQKVDPKSIRIIAIEPNEWTDSCLGLGQANETCAAEITPGYRIVLAVKDQKFEYRTDMTGNNFRQVTQ